MRPVTYSWLAVVLAVACAAIGWLGIAGWAAVMVAIATIGMHVAGNALGTKLREAADRDLSRLRRPPAAAFGLPKPRPSHLGRRQSLGMLVPVSAGIGGVIGGAAGATALATLTPATTAGALLGGVSSAVLGGLFGFLVASLVEILRTSLRESLAAERHSAAADR
ncbi:MAG: hypothetical protein ACKO4T_10730 [Planctomycetaceae bacterium]